MKKSDDIKRDIIEMVRKNNPTKTALCNKFGITWQTLKNWTEEDTEFKNEYDNAIKFYLNKINIQSNKSLEKLVKGGYYEEIKTVYMADKNGEPTIAQKTVTKKYYPPNATAVIFALSNLDPKNFE
ncbi:MAG: hypothetical protein RR220_04130 [Bacteroidaceae bacterium]